MMSNVMGVPQNMEYMFRVPSVKESCKPQLYNLQNLFQKFQKSGCRYVETSKNLGTKYSQNWVVFL
jgi:hypothetical protein